MVQFTFENITGYIASPNGYSPENSPKRYSPHTSPTKEYNPTKEVGSYNEYNPGKSKSKLDYNPSKKCKFVCINLIMLIFSCMFLVFCK